MANEGGMRMKGLSEKKAKALMLHVLLPLLLALLSMTVVASKLPESKLMQGTLESIEDSNTTVLEFAGATAAASLAVSALPDDFGTPLANSFAEMAKYFVLILVAIFVERLMVVSGVKIAFLYIIPIACLLWILGSALRNRRVIGFAKKVVILGLALAFAVPVSVNVTNRIGSSYLAYVDETISETSGGAEKINDEMSNDENGSILDKMSNAVKTAISGLTELIANFKSLIKKCMNAIAILIICNCIMPIVTLLLFRWLLKELFGIIVPTEVVYVSGKKRTSSAEEENRE